MDEQDPSSEDLQDAAELESVWDIGLGEVFGGTEDQEQKPDDGERTWCGRFRLLEEIGRGGMGHVYRAWDDRLKRDVAIKVIRHDRLNESSALSRFLEEAQIAGQLQHPGIVPIYETGLDEEDRPFFCMKLVQGEDLASILRRRDDLEASLGHLIQIFSSICQTMSFAHAQGVIHRDLKPSNIMIGPFGEVQVLDWGFAKLIDSQAGQEEALQESRHHSIKTHRSETGSSESVTGSVLGTPGYMAPEQARGEIDNIDERSDVFALGAILCEILTGAPPHARDGRQTTAEVAARGDMSAALKRIQEADAPTEMKTLAAWCLAPHREDRPRNAFVVADETASYMDHLAEERQQARIKAETAEHRLEEEKKRRKLTLTISLMILGALAAGGFYWWRAENALQETKAQIRRDYGAAVSSARERAREQSWAAMEEAFRRIEEIIRHPDAPDDLVVDYRRTADDLQSRRRKILQEAEARAAQEALATRLDEIRQMPIDDAEVVPASYRTAFLHFGVDFDQQDSEEAVEKLRELPLPTLERALAALDDWAARLARSGRPGVRPQDHMTRETSLRQRILDAAQRLDQDAWRRRLRDVAESGDVNALSDLAREEDLGQYDAQSLVLLALSLDRQRQREEALRVLELAFMAHPGDFWVNHHLTRLAALTSQDTHMSRSRRDQASTLALRHAWIAFSLQPDSRLAQHHLSMILLRRGDVRRAVSVALDADNAVPLNTRPLFGDSGFITSPSIERAFLEEAVKRRPESGKLWQQLGNLYLAMGDFRSAERAARQSLIQEPDQHDALNTLARALLGQGLVDQAMTLAMNHRDSFLLRPLIAELKTLQQLRASRRPLDLETPGQELARARLLSWDRSLRSFKAAADAWYQATRALGRRNGIQDALLRASRSPERDGTAALIALAQNPACQGEERRHVWNTALTIAQSLLRPRSPGPAGHVPIGRKREFKLWLLDPRLKAVRQGPFPDFATFADKEAWSLFWKRLHDLAN